MNLEKTIFSSVVTIVQAIGYDAGSDVPVASKTYTTTGTHTMAGTRAPGEVAALVRYSTAARSVKNHPIYAFNYYHDCDMQNTPGLEDKIANVYKTALGTYAAGWISGITAGGVTAVRATPAGHACTGYLVEEFATHRDFPPSSSV